MADGRAQDDRKDQQQQLQNEPYELERIATVLAVTCMFLAALYIIFALLLFLYFVDDPLHPDASDMTNDTSALHNHHHHHHHEVRQDKFITMPGTSVVK